MPARSLTAVRATIGLAVRQRTASAVANYPHLERMCCDLPAPHQIRLIRAMIRDSLSFSYGADDLHKGCDAIERDLREETLLNDEPGIRQAVAL